jgi:hypothetical protein
VPDYSAGTASVRITPDATSFLRDLQAKLRAVKDPRFTISVDADTGQAKADIERFRQLQQRDGMKLGVDVALGQAQADMAAFRARQQSDGLVVKVDADTGKARAELASLDNQLNKLSTRQLGFVNVGAFGAAAFQPTIAALAEVAASIQQVSQAGLALPGVFAGAAASVGTLVLGLSGIKDAYDAVSDAATSSAKDQATQARAATTASNNLRNAVVDEARAREDVARATRQSAQELRDLRTEQRGGMIDESRAILEAQKAREDLARGNYSDVRDATLRVAEADQRLIEVRNRNMTTAERLNEINRTGVQGTDAVRDAQERLTRTQQAAAEAQLAMATAANQGTAAQDKAAEAMGKLGPKAQAVVDTMVRLTPEFEKFRANISDPLLDGKAEEFEKFFTTVRPVAEQGLAGIAAGWNKNITALFGAVGSERGTGLIDRILGNTGDAQARFTQAISPLVEGIGTLTAAGTDALPRLADGAAAALDRLRDFVVQADEDGRLDKWINDGIDGATSLGNSLLNVGKTFTAITKSVGGGKEFLRWLQDATGRMQTFLNSTEGQAKLKEYFDQGRSALREFMPLLQELPGLFKALGEGSTLYVGGLLPLLTTMADLLGDHPGLVSAAVAAWLTWKTVSPIMGAVQNGINALNTGVIGIGTNFAGTRAKADAEMSRINKAFDDAGKPGSKLAGFSKSVGALAFAGGPFGILATTIASVAIPGLLALGDKFDEASEKTDNLNDRQLALEQTLDRVTGKLSAQSLDSQITAAQNYDPLGPGAGIKGISQGDAVAAATALGISPEVYGKALLNDPEAQKQVRDVLIKNNLLPEFQANQKLGTTATEISNLTGGAINQDTLLQALIGDPGAVDRYTEEIRKGAYAAANGDETTAQATINSYNLAGIAQRLSQTGQQSVLAGGALAYLTAQLPTGGPTVQRNQAQFGRFRLNSEGQGVLGGDYQVTATGPDASPDTVYKVVTPPNSEIGLRADDLERAGIKATRNPYDNSWELTLPHGSPLVEKYKKGGPTPGARNQGFLAELHGQEWVHDADTVQTYGRDVMNALWRKQIDPKAIRGLLPKFDWGGPTDPNDPNYVGGTPHLTGATPGPVDPVAPNPFTATQPGAINNITGQAVDPLANIGSNILGQFGVNIPGLQQTGTTGTGKTGMTPGLWGLAQAGDDPLKQQMWQQQTLKWLVNDWVGGTIVGGLMNSVLPNVLDSVGLGGILNNPYTAAFTKTFNHFAGMGAQTQGDAATGGMVTMPDGTQIPLDQFLTPTANGAGQFALPGATAGFTAGDAYGLDAGTNISYGGKGFPPWVYQLADQYGVEASTYSGHQEKSGQNRGIDWRPKGFAPDSPEGAAALERFANALQSAPGVEQIIYENPLTQSRVGRDPGDRGPDQTIDDYYRDDWAGHRDHVHTRFATGLISGDPAAAGGSAPVPGSPGFASFLKQLYGDSGAPAPGIGASSAGLNGLKGRAYRAYIESGLPPDEWAAFDRLIQKESSWDPTARNPTSGAFGLQQFLGHENDIYGQLGGYSTDPMKQLAAGFQYIRDRYHGSPAAALAFHDANNWYLNGGHTPGSKNTPIPAVLHGDEFVHRNAAVEKYGLPFMNAVNDLRLDPDQIPHMAVGGAARDALRLAMARPTPPPPRPPDAQTKKPRPAPPATPPVAVRPPTPAAPPAPAPAPPPVAVQPPEQSPTFAPAEDGTGGVAPPGPTDYTLPWVNQAIESGASAIGSAVQTAVAAAAAGGTMGMSALAGGGGSLGGISIQGMFQQGGKVVQGVANVISGALVGSVPGSFMTTPEAYGRTLRPEQNVPKTAMPPFSGGRSATYHIQGVDTRNMLQELQMRENIEAQSALANLPEFR